jgi:hypothetical protein
MSEPSEEELAAVLAQREAAASRIDEAIGEIEGQISIAEAADDTKSVGRLRDKLPVLRRKREEILRGERGA